MYAQIKSVSIWTAKHLVSVTANVKCTWKFVIKADKPILQLN